jgi:uncharacterized protein (TIGR02453 family)
MGRRQYFEADFLRFFEDLTQNNEKAWFETQKARYERSVKLPFETLVMDFQERVVRRFPGFPPRKPGELIFRIHRDVRFSKDKSPYKTHAAAYFARGGKTSETAGFYMQFGADQILFGGGVWNLDKNNLYLVRRHIVENGDELAALVAHPEFAHTYAEIRGEKNKKLPRDFAHAPERAAEWIKHKQFLYWANLPAQACLSPTIMDEVERHFAVAQPVNDFFNAVLLPAHLRKMSNRER